jgi:hypothetical protein
MGIGCARLVLVRGSQTPPPPQVRSCHDALLGTRHRKIGALIEASEKVCELGARKSPTLAIVRARGKRK